MSVEVHYVTPSEHSLGCLPTDPDADMSSRRYTQTAEERDDPLYMFYAVTQSVLRLSRTIPPNNIIREIGEAEDVLVSELMALRRKPVKTYEEGEDCPRKPHEPDTESIALAYSAAGSMNAIYAIAHDKPDNLRKAAYQFSTADEYFDGMGPGAAEAQVYNAHRASEVSAIVGDVEGYMEWMDLIRSTTVIEPQDFYELMTSRWEEYAEIRSRWQTKGPAMLPDQHDEPLTQQESIKHAQTAAEEWRVGGIAVALVTTQLHHVVTRDFISEEVVTEDSRYFNPIF